MLVRYVWKRSQPHLCTISQGIKWTYIFFVPEKECSSTQVNSLYLDGVRKAVTCVWLATFDPSLVPNSIRSEIIHNVKHRGFVKFYHYACSNVRACECFWMLPADSGKDEGMCPIYKIADATIHFMYTYLSIACLFENLE